MWMEEALTLTVEAADVTGAERTVLHDAGRHLPRSHSPLEQQEGTGHRRTSPHRPPGGLDFSTVVPFIAAHLKIETNHEYTKNDPRFYAEQVPVFDALPRKYRA